MVQPQAPPLLSSLILYKLITISENVKYQNKIINLVPNIFFQFLFAVLFIVLIVFYSDDERLVAVFYFCGKMSLMLVGVNLISFILIFWR